MAETEERIQSPWMSSEQSSIVKINGHDLSITEPMLNVRDGSEFGASQVQHDDKTSDSNLGIGERAISAAGAAFLSAIIVNPLDVVKVMIISSLARFLLMNFRCIIVSFR